MNWIDGEFLIYALVGFCAQLVDGSLGMAYGTLSMTVLLWSGVPPASASDGVHTAQFFTTGISGLSHALFHNVNWKLCLTLAAAGIAGGVLGAGFLVSIDAHLIKPWISAYLLLLGILVLRRVWRGHGAVPRRQARHDPVDENHPFRWRLKELALGFTGGGLDAIGGGGWGPIVTTNLLATGMEPRYTIGSVNMAEFFVKTATATAFFATLGSSFSGVVVGLLVGGALGAPFGALVLRRIRAEHLMSVVGCLIIGLSAFQLLRLMI